MRYVVFGVLATWLALGNPGAGRAAEIPESVHRLYVMGARDVRLASDVVRVPLRGTDQHGAYRSPYLRTYINGKGPFTFLFDTGSNITVISSAVARAAGVQTISAVPGHHRIVRADEIRVRGIVMRDYYAVIADGDDVDGIFGINAFGRTYLTFDFAGHALIVSRRAVPLPRAVWLPYTTIKRLPNIELRIDGKTLPTLLDTGDDAYSWEATAHDLAGLTFDDTPRVATAVVNGQTGTTRTRVTTVDGTLALGPFRAERPAVGINESLPVPDLGMPVLDQFTLEFDRVHKRVAFAPRSTGVRFRVPGVLTLGFSLRFDFVQPRVRSVIPGMAPDRTGLRPDDSLVRIDGRPAASFDYPAWGPALALARARRARLEPRGRRAQRDVSGGRTALAGALVGALVRQRELLGPASRVLLEEFPAIRGGRCMRDVDAILGRFALVVG
jgi:predicted aspartyl protease